MRAAVRPLVTLVTLAMLAAFAAALGPGMAAAQQARPSGPRAATTAKPGDAAASRRLARLGAARRWGYQLRLLSFPAIAASPFDLVVLDHALSAARRFVHQFTPEEIAAAKRKPDGARRLVLAYLSVGEAERYRFYWNQDWYDPARKPQWLTRMNETWDGNYLVRFWDPEWQRLLMEGPDSYVERVRAQGFDGIYIDRADVFQEWSKSVPDAEARMVRLLGRLAEAARRSDPDFLIVMQNAEELLRHPQVLAAIDGIAKEDLYFGVNHDQRPNSAQAISEALADLRRAKKAGRPVFVVEYLDEAAPAASARRKAEAEGFRIHFTGRDLGDLSPDPPDAPGLRTGR